MPLDLHGVDLDAIFRDAPVASVGSTAERERPLRNVGSLVFDIETGPLSDGEIEAIAKPFDKSTLPPSPPPFDESQVNFGRTTDEAKRQAKVKAARREHERLHNQWVADCNRLTDEWWAEVKKESALSPLTGQVLAIGCQVVSRTSEPYILGEGLDEADLLGLWWDEASSVVDFNHSLIGFNCNNFDLPFLIRRSWRLGVELPKWASQVYLHTLDLYLQWQCWGESRGPSHVDNKLSTIAAFLGAGNKANEGERFAGRWRDERTRQQARDYLLNDIRVTFNVARKMGVI